MYICDVCICVYVFVYMYVGACMLYCTRGDQRTASDTGPCPLPSCLLLCKPRYLARSFWDYLSSASHLSVGVLD